MRWPFSRGDELREDESLPLKRVLVSEINEIANGLARDAHVVQPQPLYTSNAAAMNL